MFSDQFPLNGGYYLTPDAPAKWIGPIADGTQSAPAGNYVYEVKFTVPVGETASIVGQYASDNPLTEIDLNGHAVLGPLNISDPNTPPYLDPQDQSSYRNFHPFSISNGFVSGVNTLDFTVYNAPLDGGMNPTALLVEATANLTPTPEPSTFALAILGAFGAIAYSLRRRRMLQLA
jgi:hypothetical protein